MQLSAAYFFVVVQQIPCIVFLDFILSTLLASSLLFLFSMGFIALFILFFLFCVCCSLCWNNSEYNAYQLRLSGKFCKLLGRADFLVSHLDFFMVFLLV